MRRHSALDRVGPTNGRTSGHEECVQPGQGTAVERRHRTQTDQHRRWQAWPCRRRDSDASHSQRRRSQTYVQPPQLTIWAHWPAAFTRALTCLSRYGDDLVIHADAEGLSLSSTNSSLSAYCRFKYGTRFFSRYRVGNGVNGDQGTSANATNDDVKGQLLTKVCFRYTMQGPSNISLVDLSINSKTQDNRQGSGAV